MARKPRIIEAGAWEVQARPAHAEPLKVGERVFHKKFGYGRVTGVDDNKVDVECSRNPTPSGCWTASWSAPDARRLADAPFAPPDRAAGGAGDRRAAGSMPCRPSRQRFQTVCARSPISATSRPRPGGSRAVREAGVGEDELTGALALAATARGIEPPALLVGPIEAEGWLARTIEVFPEAPIGRRFLVRADPCAEPGHLWPDRAAAGCRAGLRQRRARLDPGLPDGLRGDGASEAAADAGPRHGVGDPGIAAAKLAAPAGAGDGYRALVGPRRGENAALNGVQRCWRRGWRMAGGAG